MLITITKDGARRDVVAQIAKNGRTYVLDRETGQPVFPMEEVSVPASDIPGEHAAAKQLLPALPPPFTRQSFTEDLITTRTAAAGQAVREQWLGLRKGGEYVPPSLQGTILFPGMDGGGEWGGAADHLASGLFYVNANEMAWIVKLAERPMPEGGRETGKSLYVRYCASCHKTDKRGQPPEFPSLVDIAGRRSVDEVAGIVYQGQAGCRRLRSFTEPLDARSSAT